MVAKLHELQAAYYQGLNEMQGIDPRVAEDLGIPMSPDSFFEATHTTAEEVIPSYTSEPTPPVVKNPKIYELPGKNGRRNPHSQPSRPQDVQRGMSAEAIDAQNAINKRGHAMVKAAYPELWDKK